MDISILEIRNAKCLMIDREWLAGIMPTAERIINGELHTDKMEKKLQARVTMAASGNQFLMSEPGNENHGTQVESNEAYLNIIFVEGLVTRNGGACTYGSKQMRNLIMQASDDDDCKGHVLILDTPGGLATAVADFKMAIDYANSKDLWVDGVIDGACCSLGIYIGSMCNHLYYTSPSDRVGSVGTFAILDVMKNGDVDPTTGEKHYEIYDPESYDKNDWYRQLSEEGKSDLIVEDLKRDGKEFRDFVKSRRPGCTDEQLHGKVYKCSEVEGSFVDGQRTLQEVFQDVMAHYYETHKQNAGKSATILSNKNNSIKMKEQFPALFAALQVEEMQMQEGGAFVNTDLLATLNAAIEAKEKAAADAQALVESLTTEKNELTAKVETLNADIEAKNLEIATLTENAGKADETLKAKDDEIAALNTDIQSKQAAIDGAKAEMEQKDATIATLNDTIASLQGEAETRQQELTAAQTELAGAKESLTTAEQTLAERDQQITDLNAQLTELQNNPGAEPAAGAAPKNNGGADAPQLVVNQYVYDPALSYKENRELEAKWNAEHGKA